MKNKVKGVNWDKNRKKWRSRIYINKKTIELGMFDNFEEAVKVRKNAEEKYSFKKDEFIGKKIGKLTVIKSTGEKIGRSLVYECKCECGNLKYGSRNSLRNTYSCGCVNLKVDDLTGKRFGRLIVLELEGFYNASTQWKCKCDCGSIKIISRNSLMSGATKSCGCISKEFYTIEGTKNLKKQIIDGTHVTLIKSDKISKRNTSGVKGVYQTKNGKWRAMISFQLKQYSLGTYEKKEDAIAARKEAEERLHKEFLREKGLID